VAKGLVSTCRPFQEAGRVSLFLVSDRSNRFSTPQIASEQAVARKFCQPEYQTPHSRSQNP